jgi:hypothetical protein
MITLEYSNILNNHSAFNRFKCRNGYSITNITSPSEYVLICKIKKHALKVPNHPKNGSFINRIFTRLNNAGVEKLQKVIDLLELGKEEEGFEMLLDRRIK